MTTEAAGAEEEVGGAATPVIGALSLEARSDEDTNGGGFLELVIDQDTEGVFANTQEDARQVMEEIEEIRLFLHQAGQNHQLNMLAAQALSNGGIRSNIPEVLLEELDQLMALAQTAPVHNFQGPNGTLYPSSEVRIHAFPEDGSIDDGITLGFLLEHAQSARRATLPCTFES